MLTIYPYVGNVEVMAIIVNAFAILCAIIMLIRKDTKSAGICILGILGADLVALGLYYISHLLG